MLPSIALAGKRPENVQWLKYRCFNRLSMCLSVSVFCAICPGARSSLAGFGTGFGSAEDLRAGAGGSPRIRPIGRVARGPSGGSSDHTLWSFFVSQAVFASTRLRIGENPARNSSRAWEAALGSGRDPDQAMGTRCSTMRFSPPLWAPDADGRPVAIAPGSRSAFRRTTTGTFRKDLCDRSTT